MTSAVSSECVSFVSVICRYFRALSTMENRFPISKDREHVNVTFTWTDAIQHRKKTRQSNIQFEKAAVLFNIGAMLSQHGAFRDTSSSEGCKETCATFQVCRQCSLLLLCNPARFLATSVLFPCSVLS